ncbi:glucose 1-dehydrogenase 2-like [Oppia nitens]|uniref:glucose 1-dehydrogenase 2-like n=1 Tax=Oppia nitens TaxID=1686743 RepID=UPI0023DB670B|nr:glucose 1-dehydrogenase 2-like [Oppia nitens]
MDFNMNFKDKVILVTGSNSGIGESTVLLFSQLGAKVVVTGRDKHKNELVANKCQQISPNNYMPLKVMADMAKEEDINRLIDSVVQHFGQIDVLVNNAAIGGGHPDETLEELDNYYNINLRSVYQLCTKAKPFLEITKGSIVNISSINGLKPFPNVSYCISKAGLDMLTRCLAINWGPIGIRVNGLNPGQIDTPIWEASTSLSRQQIDDMWKAVDANYPVRRRGYPEDIAKAIVFLASKESSFITGVNVRIDGGFLDSASLIL